ncbi:hypothetical protein Calag_0491 [Caldisphaera lagunensis DSM 15908]|uniref:Uncharacterized protein n=1 Tax=Caldisphaera lagunensis (strain DSM 15908 / JCM 11604 / ANMR 0165 / IC-154) TaxID=1056495 RepID=L0AAV4_CALLD|nr:hypothetical protein [Caldisphaera lagunensis]AFZ70257.1 hypothetical protein Calag_0491 [Caldisphaera lagunensis DSM 15908]
MIKKKLFVALIMLLIPFISITGMAQSLSYSISNTSVTINNQYYQIYFNLSNGATITSWKTLVPQVNQFNSVEIPSMVVSLNESIPGNLYNKAWKASLINKNSNYVKVVMTPVNNINNVSVYEFITASNYYPYINYEIIVNTTANESYIKDLYIAIGGNYDNNSWSFVVSSLENGIPNYYVTNSSGSYSGNIMKIAMFSYSSKAYNSIIGLNFISPVQANLQFLKGFINGTLESNIAYTIIDIKNITLSRGNSYEISFNLYDAQFNPELISLTDSTDMASQVYNINGNITNLVNYQTMIKSYLNNITSLNQSVNSLETKVGELQGLVSYWQVRYNETNQLAGSYSTRLHKSGEVSIGLFILGLVIGVLGGAYFLKPKPLETVPSRQQKKETKKK